MGAIVAVILNLAFWLCMFVVQKQEVRMGRIHPRRPHNQKRPQDGFIYIQDYHTTSWGDLIALSLIDAVIGAEVQVISWWLAAICLGVGLSIGLYFHFTKWLGPYHKPDWAYPKKGEVSLGGQLHVAYFSLQVAVVLGALWLLVGGDLTISQASVGLAGGALYLVAIFLDIKSNRWAGTPIQRG